MYLSKYVLIYVYEYMHVQSCQFKNILIPVLKRLMTVMVITVCCHWSYDYNADNDEKDGANKIMTSDDDKTRMGQMMQLDVEHHTNMMMTIVIWHRWQQWQKWWQHQKRCRLTMQILSQPDKAMHMDADDNNHKAHDNSKR